MPSPTPARCDGRDVLTEARRHTSTRPAPGACTRPAPAAFQYICTAGHEGVARACEPHGLRILAGQDAKPSTVCPQCGEPAWYAAYCGMCRKGAHGDCRAYRGASRAMAGMSPARPDEHCACTCDPYDDEVPGIRGARQPKVEAA